MFDRFTKTLYNVLLSARWLLVVFYGGLGLRWQPMLMSLRIRRLRLS